MISIVIPTLNEGAGLEKTLRNLAGGLKETEYEIIISDGKSTDNTREIAARYAHRVVVYNKLERQTIGQGKNAGAKEGRGEFLVFIDADVTIPSPDLFFKKALGDFERDPLLAGLGSRIRVLPELERFSDRFFRGLLNCYNIFMNNVLALGTGSGEFQMVRKSSFDSIGGFNEKIVAGEDHDLFMRLARIARTRFDPKLTVYERGRRARAVGWPWLMSVWILNALSVTFFKRSVSKEWKEVR